MKKLCKKLAITIMSFSLLLPFTLSSIAAKEISTINSNLPTHDEFSIIDSHIQETLFEFKIINESQLEQKIGKETLEKLKTHLQKQNIEKSKEFERAAVDNVHRSALRAIGCGVETHWWGERIKTYNRQMTIYVRRMALGFGSRDGGEEFVQAATFIGLGYLPGIGPVATAVGLIMGMSSWADSKTWLTVAGKVADKIDEGDYNLTIDINAWNMEVKVY